MAVIRSTHERGVLPDWWQVPFSGVSSDLTNVVTATNPQCRGLVAFLDEVDRPATAAILRGRDKARSAFAIHGGFLHAFAHRWLEGGANDTQTIEALRACFTQLATGE
jgi:myo-inositol catabolism protein IolC